MSEDKSGSKFYPVPGGGKGAEKNVDGKVLIGSLDEPNDPNLFVEAQYNPKELEIAKSVPWSKVNEANKSNQKSDQSQGVHMEFTGAEGRSISLELLFDSYETKDDRVSKSVAALEKLASVRKPGNSKEEFKRPHRCLVVWGSAVKMSCVIDSLSVKYTMFSPEGKPLRATCVLKLKEADVVSTAKKKK
ncbi:MAG TPA: hypothetical protein VIV11_25550 [Kofleriaceae bacterium]